MVKSSPNSHRRTWNTIKFNNILHRKSANLGLLPSSVYFLLLDLPVSLHFAILFEDKISQLQLSLSAHSAHSNHYPATPPDSSAFPPATVVDVLQLTHDCPNKQSSLDVLHTSLLKLLPPSGTHHHLHRKSQSHGLA